MEATWVFRLLCVCTTVLSAYIWVSVLMHLNSRLYWFKQFENDCKDSTRFLLGWLERSWRWLAKRVELRDLQCQMFFFYFIFSEVQNHNPNKTTLVQKCFTVFVSHKIFRRFTTFWKTSLDQQSHGGTAAQGSDTHNGKSKGRSTDASQVSGYTYSSLTLQ